MSSVLQNGAGGKGTNTHLQYLKTLLIMVAAVLIVSQIVPHNDIGVEVGDEAFSVFCVAGNAFSSRELASAEIAYDNIESIELIDTAVQGDLVEGYTGRRGMGSRYDAGTWNWAGYGGDYDLIIREDTKYSILITLNDGHRVVFNFENTDSTDNLYNALIDYLK